MNLTYSAIATQRSALWLVATAAFSSAAMAQQNPMQIDVTGSRESASSILTPTKILQGNELQDKLGTTLGATIGNELGVSQTGYGLGASRPVMRGLEGARVQILQNGLSVGDVSAISADHAVASPVANARQIEILRGAAALLYGSGSSGGLVNVVNDRILTTLPDKPTGAVNTSYDTVSNGRAASGVIESSVGSVAVHVDTAINNNQNYRIPGYAEQNGPNANWKINPNGEAENVAYSGKLPNSFNNQNNLGVGASYIGKSGYTGISVERLNNNYGIPTPEGGMIAQSQNRYDFQHQTRDPFAGFSSIKFSAANSNYNHTEFSITNGAYTPAALWKNIANEARLELAHKAIMGWKGTFGAQVTRSSVEAVEIGSGSYAILPSTKTNSNALFWIEEGRWGALQGNLGLRYDNVKQNPNSSTVLSAEGPFASPTTDPTAPQVQSKNFNLISYSAGGLWYFANGYGTGLSYTVSQRAPSAQELYSYGIHESTATFAVGNSNLSKETSHNLEFNLQKTMGQVRGKVNVYLNKFNNYIYGFYTGQYITQAADEGKGFSVVQAQQAAATIKGTEGELTYNWGNVGSGARLFADASQGTFDAGGNLPLQPAPRVGVQVAHQKNGWLANASYTYSFQQNRLATWEVGPTPSYNLLNAGLSYTEKINKVSWTGYMMLKNILNDDIRYATTPMAVRLYAPQPGRSLMVGVRANF
ncbi:TonB-dependent receptor [Polynucleobacter sp. MWH-UH24A]|uniref:TonB-dependent receptor n=1 Tax=Polynucleobacter sp. MWH-UH24A TaxID=2689110 RepID=UPI001BFDF52F|nr:TonB-dependent receptor [Polynucleobacter sp. MWH-UH24A]QWD75429.1 TonB-dependent receptor [Polynucleobacter sp. MWH-UH24A]